MPLSALCEMSLCSSVISSWCYVSVWGLRRTYNDAGPDAFVSYTSKINED